MADEVTFAAIGERLSWREIIQKWSKIIGDNWPLIAIFVAAFATINVVIEYLSSGSSNFLANSIAFVAISLLKYYLISNAINSQGLPKGNSMGAWHYIVVNLFLSFGVFGGLLLLIVPGVYLAIRWVAVGGFVTSGEAGVTEAFSKSWQATAGNELPILQAALALVLVCLFVLAVFFGIPALLIESTSPLAMTTMEAIGGAIGNALAVIFMAAVYCLLVSHGKEIEETFA